MGVEYFNLKNCSELDNFELHIVETKGVCEKGREIFKHVENVLFYETVPEDVNPDIINIASAMQYLVDYKGAFLNLAGMNPKYILLTNTLMSSEDTYATTQVNIKDVVIPAWIFNLEEIRNIMLSAGYVCVFQSSNDRPENAQIVGKGDIVSSNILFSCQKM